MKVLMVITSHDQLGNTGRKTGFWLEELAAPYYVFKDAGVDITLASPKGGRPPLDPKSNEPEFRTELTLRFESDEEAEAQLDQTVRLDSVKQEDFDTVFYPGGHGPMWDLAEDKDSIKLIESFLAAGKTIARRVPFDRCAAPRQDGRRQAAGARQGSDRLHQRRGRRGRPDQGRAVPCRRRDAEARRRLLEDSELGSPCRQRRAADHGTKPAFLGSGRADADGKAEGKRQAEDHRPGFVDR